MTIDANKIQYLAAANAVYRSVRARLRDALHIDDFAGANDTETLQNAMDEIRSQAGGALVAASRVYNINGEITGSPALTFFGNGARFTQAYSGTAGATKPIISWDGTDARDVQVFGGSWIGPGFSIPFEADLGTVRTITVVTKANPCVVTVDNITGLTGQLVRISGVSGLTPAINGTYYLIATGGNDFNLQSMDGTVLDTSATTGTAVGGTATKINGGSYGLLRFQKDASFGNDIVVQGAVMHDAFNLLATNGINRAWIAGNNFSNFALYAHYAFAMTSSEIVLNSATDCLAEVSFTNFGFFLSGDEDASLPCKDNVLAFNLAQNIPSWAGYGTHDSDNTLLIGNRAVNTRMGFNWGAATSPAIVRSTTLLGNYHLSTTTDTWLGAAANNASFEFLNGDASLPSEYIEAVGNISKNVGNISGATFALSPSGLVVRHCDYLIDKDNSVFDAGEGAGKAYFGDFKSIQGGGHTLQGNMDSGAFLLLNTTIRKGTLGDMTVAQTVATDPAIKATSTVFGSEGLVSIGRLSTNSTIPFQNVSGNTFTAFGWDGPISKTFTSLTTNAIDLMYVDVATITLGGADTLKTASNYIPGRTYILVFTNTNCTIDQTGNFLLGSTTFTPAANTAYEFVGTATKLQYKGVADANIVQSVVNDTNVTGSIAGNALTLGWTGTLAAARLNANVVQAITNDTNINGSIAAQNLTFSWAGTLAAGRLNANVVQAITNDTNVTGSIAAQNLTLGWTGTLSAARGGTANAGGAWSTYTPTITSGSGTPTTTSATGRYRIIGDKYITVMVDIIMTDAGTAGGNVIASLPVTVAAARYVGSAFEYQATGVSGATFVGASGTTFQAAPASGVGTFWLTGNRLVMQATFEIA